MGYETGVLVRRILHVAAVILLMTFGNACAQHPSQQSASPTPGESTKVQTPKEGIKPKTSNAKIQLNGEDMGTTNDTSVLGKFLKNVIRMRDEQTVTRYGTDEIEKTVFVRAGRSIKLDEFFKVVTAISEAGASPVQLPIEVERLNDEYPSKLTLLVDIGNPEFPKEISRGIDLHLGGPLNRSDKDAFMRESLAVLITREGTYAVGETAVLGPALGNALKAAYKELPEGRSRAINLILESDSEISYGSLAEVADAAFKAGAPELYIVTLTP